MYALFFQNPQSLHEESPETNVRKQGVEEKSLQGRPLNQSTRLTHDGVRKNAPQRNSTPEDIPSAPYFQPPDLPADSLNSRGSSENKTFTLYNCTQIERHTNTLSNRFCWSLGAHSETHLSTQYFVE